MQKFSRSNCDSVSGLFSFDYPLREIFEFERLKHGEFFVLVCVCLNNNEIHNSMKYKKISLGIVEDTFFIKWESHEVIRSKNFDWPSVKSKVSLNVKGPKTSISLVFFYDDLKNRF